MVHDNSSIPRRIRICVIVSGCVVLGNVESVGLASVGEDRGFLGLCDQIIRFRLGSLDLLFGNGCRFIVDSVLKLLF